MPAARHGGADGTWSGAWTGVGSATGEAAGDGDDEAGIADGDGAAEGDGERDRAAPGEGSAVAHEGDSSAVDTASSAVDTASRAIRTCRGRRRGGRTIGRWYDPHARVDRAAQPSGGSSPASPSTYPSRTAFAAGYEATSGCASRASRAASYDPSTAAVTVRRS